MFKLKFHKIVSFCNSHYKCKPFLRRKLHGSEVEIYVYIPNAMKMMRYKVRFS